MKQLFCFLFFVASLSCFAQQASINIIPQPAKVEVKEGSFIFTSKVDIIYNDGISANTAKKIIDTLKKKFNIIPTLAEIHPYHSGYKKVYIDYEKDYPQKEGYKIDISENKIFLKVVSVDYFMECKRSFNFFPQIKKCNQRFNALASLILPASLIAACI